MRRPGNIIFEKTQRTVDCAGFSAVKLFELTPFFFPSMEAFQQFLNCSPLSGARPAPCLLLARSRQLASALSWPPRLSAKQARRGSHAVTHACMASGVPTQLQRAGMAAGSSLASRAGAGLRWKSQPRAGTALPAEEAAGSGSDLQLQLAPGDALLRAQSPGSARGVAP